MGELADCEVQHDGVERRLEPFGELLCTRGHNRAALAARALDGSEEEVSSSSDVQQEALVALLTDALSASA